MITRSHEASRAPSDDFPVARLCLAAGTRFTTVTGLRSRHKAAYTNIFQNTAQQGRRGHDIASQLTGRTGASPPSIPVSTAMIIHCISTCHTLYVTHRLCQRL